MAFDTGPGNMAIDRCMGSFWEEVRQKRGGGSAGAGAAGVVERVLREGYFAAAAPKSCGREEFGAGFAERLIWDVPGGGRDGCGFCGDGYGADAESWWRRTGDLWFHISRRPGADRSRRCSRRGVGRRMGR